MIVALAFVGCSTPAPDQAAKASANLAPALAYTPGMAANVLPPPAPISAVKPVYPFEAARAEISGTVTVVFAIDQAGLVHDIQIIECKRLEFRDSTLGALARWRFPRQAGGPYKLTFSYVSTGDMGGNINWK